MDDDTDHLDIVRVDRGKVAGVKDTVSRELPIGIMLNEVDIATLMCSPMNLDCLAVGFLFTEGFIEGKEDINSIDVDEMKRVVRVEAGDGKPPSCDAISGRFIAASGGRGMMAVDLVEKAKSLKFDSPLAMSSDSVFPLMKEFLSRSKGFEKTGAIHSAALCNAEDILAFHEDIGRHNAIDKVAGEFIIEGGSTRDKILVTSGRISAEILVKAARCRTPLVISKSAPTDLAVRLAADIGIAIVGFAREQRMNVYSNAWRIGNESL